MDFSPTYILALVIFSLYALAMLFIFLYSIAQFHLVLKYLFGKKSSEAIPKLQESELPFVSVQLPIYNEKLVAARLIDCIAEFDYPKEKFEIQVLDDSNDETIDIISERVKHWHTEGLQIEHIQREDRTGFKAGALAYGLEKTKGEFIAIFDADFLPEKDFLKKTIPHFQNTKIGMVQTRWGHLNRDYSMLTKMQAFALDGHFTIEQSGRNQSHAFINFNGTAGVWRKSCIIDSGNWSHDTLTEDLDLSYRAQIKGWEFIYLEDVCSPSELPPIMSAIKSQQYRWLKGGAETARKHFREILTTKMSFQTRFHAIFHLLNNLVFLCIITSALASVPLLLLKNHLPELNALIKYGAIFLFSYLSIGTVYFIANFKNEKKSILNFLKFTLKFPLFLCVSMGLSLHNSIAIIEGYFGKKTPFIRTPKFNLTKGQKALSKNNYLLSGINFMTIIEGLLFLYFISGIALSFYFKDFSILPFHLSLTIGFGIIFFYSLAHEKYRA